MCDLKKHTIEKILQAPGITWPLGKYFLTNVSKVVKTVVFLIPVALRNLNNSAIGSLLFMSRQTLGKIEGPTVFRRKRLLA